MHRPLRVPIHLRIWHLIRGLLFYNTVYWRRASDGLNMPSLTAEEREQQRPERNLEIIKPRMRPRAHIEAAKGGEISTPKSQTASEPTTTASVVEKPPVSDPAVSASQAHLPEDMGDGTEMVYVKRRRYRRRLVARGSPIDQGSFIARVFGKK